MRRIVSHLTGAIIEGALISLLVIGLIAAPAFAARSGNKPIGSQTGSCAVTPDPVAVGSDYTMIASGLAANHLVNVDISDSQGTTIFNLQTDGAGTVSVTWHPYWVGTSSVAVTDTTGRKPALVASCQFQVVAAGS